jgi:alkylation response protein AidB-like acyl-CoA dehydrogenase
MRFELNEDQALLQRSTRDFFAAEYPLEQSRRLMEDEPRGFDDAAWRRLAEMGYLGLTVPTEQGGQALGAIDLAIVLEEAGRQCIPGPLLDAVLAADLLARGGGQDARLADLLAGRRLVTIARRGALFGATPGDTPAVVGGRIRGTSSFVPFATAADALIIVAGDALVLADGPFDVTPLPTIDPAQRFGRVDFEHAVTALGPATLLEDTDRLAAVGAAAMLLGVMSRMLETTLEYVQTRATFGRPIGSFQSLQHRLADMLLRTESSRSAVYRAAWCVQTGSADAPLACAAAKAYAGDAARLVCGEAIQMHGGIGFTWELDVHVYFKRAKTLEQHYGSTASQLGAALAAAGY